MAPPMPWMNRAEIIGGLKRQDFLVAQGKSIVPTDAGLKLFGVLKQADPALVDPGVTAQLECLLDDVVIGKQEMVGAIDAVCEVAQRIIGKLKNGAAAGGTPLGGPGFSGSGGNRPPTPAMKRFAVSISRQKRVNLPAGYATSSSICRAFLQQHAPNKSEASTIRKRSSSTDINAGEEQSQRALPVKSRAKRGSKSAKLTEKGPDTPARRARNPKAVPAPVSGLESTALQRSAAENTPLRIPFGNKEVAQKLGARYAAGGWYAPRGVDLAAFGAHGWL